MHLHDLAERVGRADKPRQAAAQLDEVIPEPLRSGSSAAALRGEWLGHALHPMSTDLPLGLFTSSTVLDLVGWGRYARASSLLNAAGLAAVVPTVATGLAEWDQVPDERRGVAVVHASSNAIAAGWYLAALIARRRGRHNLAAAAGLAGGLTAAFGGYLGGHLAIGRGVGGGPRRGLAGGEPTVFTG